MPGLGLSVRRGLSAQTIDLGAFTVDASIGAAKQLFDLPEGQWDSFTLTADWSALSPEATPVDVPWTLNEETLSGGSLVIVESGLEPMIDSLGATQPLRLEWSGTFDPPLQSPPFARVSLNVSAAVPDAVFQWSDTAFTFGRRSPVLPSTREIFDLNQVAAGQDVVTLAPAELAWYEVVHPGGRLYVSTSFPETTIFGHDPQLPETQIGIYSAVGELVDFSTGFGARGPGTILTDLPVGTYFVVAGGPELLLPNDFAVRTSNDNSGDIKVSVSTFVPPPDFRVQFDLAHSSAADQVFSLTPHDVAWVEIVHPGGELLLSTQFPETTISGGANLMRADTEMALFDAGGILLLENDDISPEAGILTSRLDVDLPSGMYYVAVAGWDAEFRDGFQSFGDNPLSGHVRLAARLVPEPATTWLGLWGVGWAALLMRRSR
ncbi:MAG: hypothetical protein KDA60_07550, partial [Planctomycetales bacterium]|nr:hypothetical protein [Planctomycetales bacterium]